MSVMEVKTVCGPSNYAEAWRLALNTIFDGAVILCCAAKQTLFPVESAFCKGRFRENLVFDSRILSTGKRCKVSINFLTGRGELSAE